MKLYTYCQDGKQGVIDSSGKVVIRAMYEFVGPWHQGVFPYCDEGRWGILSADGSVVRAPEFSEAHKFSEGIMGVKRGGLWGAVDLNGAWRVECKFSKIGHFGSGLAPAQLTRTSLTGFIDSAGMYKVDPQYEFALAFSEGLAVVREVEGRVGYLGADGSMAIPAKFSLGYSFREGLAAVSSRKAADRFGFVDRTGKEVIAPVWKGAQIEFSEGRACVWQGGKYGYINISRDGELLIPYRYAFCGRFSGGLAPCSVHQGRSQRCGYIGLGGDWMIPPQFIDADEFDGNLALVRGEDKEGYIDRLGRWVINWTVDDRFFSITSTY